MKRLLVLGALALVTLSAGAPQAPAHSTQCSAVRAVFYSSSDWARLAQGLAADPSSCAQYYISIDPLAADKTVMRPNAAPQVDALGSQFHALAEVNYTAWQNWVNQTGNSWYAAGQAARSAMDTAGFNIANGDTWAVNEFPSSVRTNSGDARQNAEQFVNGLYAGNGSDGTAQGVVFMIGVGQTGISSLATYKASLESWFQDSTFWSTMGADVSDFFYEVYGDVRAYAVAGEDPATRAANLTAYLEHPLALATAAGAPASEASARTFLSSAYGPLANASWAWNDDYGWTQVDSATMADYVSAQTYAMRLYPGDTRLGFAWNPLNTQGLDSTDFNTDVAGILDRLAGSIHETDGGDPEQACEATGCSAVLAGAAPATDWSTFASWTPTLAAFTSAPQTLNANAASAPVTLELQTGGVATNLPNSSTVTLSSSSHTGLFSTTPSGPWTPTLALTIPAETESATFYTEDSVGGSPTLSANLGGEVSTQVETVITPTPAPTPTAAASVTALAFTTVNDHMHVALQVVGASGQPLQATVSLALLLGSTTVATTSGATGADGDFGLTAAAPLARGCYRVAVQSVTASGYSWNGVAPSGSDCVTTLPLEVRSVAFTPRAGRMHLALRVAAASGQPVVAHISFALRVGSATVAQTGGETNVDGLLGVTPAPLLERGCYRVEVSAVSAPGYRWSGSSPTQTRCVTSLPAHVGGVAFATRHGHLHVSLEVTGEAGKPLQATVSFALVHNGAVFASTHGLSASDGRIGLTARGALAPGCYTLRVDSVTAPGGYAWDRVAPAGSDCVGRR